MYITLVKKVKKIYSTSRYRFNVTLITSYTRTAWIKFHPGHPWHHGHPGDWLCLFAHRKPEMYLKYRTIARQVNVYCTNVFLKSISSILYVQHNTYVLGVQVGDFLYTIHVLRPLFSYSTTESHSEHIRLHRPFLYILCIYIKQYKIDRDKRNTWQMHPCHGHGAVLIT